MNNPTKEKLDILYHKYKGLEELYYSLYIDSFFSSIQELLEEDISTNQGWSQSVEHCEPKGIIHPYPLERRCNFLKLHNNFKEVCRLLAIVKQLCEPEEGDTISAMLGLGEIKVLINFKDIRALLDTNDLYPLVYSNHDFW